MTAFNGDMVEELELHEGAYPVRFADRSAGVPDVHTRDGSRTGDAFRLAASASNAGGMLYVLESFSSLNRDFATDLGINALTTAGYHYTLGNLGWRYSPTSRLLVANHAAWMREKFDNNNPTRLPLGAGYYGEWVWNASATILRRACSGIIIRSTAWRPSRPSCQPRACLRAEYYNRPIRGT